jgi:uncharacterized DUF497 family protein
MDMKFYYKRVERASVRGLFFLLQALFAVTIPDEEHSETEVRWITLGKDTTGHYALVVHTFEWLADDRGRVRLISARRPTKAEIRDYEEQI